MKMMCVRDMRFATTVQHRVEWIENGKIHHSVDMIRLSKQCMLRIIWIAFWKTRYWKKRIVWIASQKDK